MRKIRIAICVLILLLLALGAVWYVSGGVSNRTILDAVLAESSAIQNKVDQRADELSAKLDRADRKLDRIEGKLDKLLEIANRPLPDGMERAE